MLKCNSCKKYRVISAYLLPKLIYTYVCTTCDKGKYKVSKP